MPATRAHYLICDYLQVRDWVLEFAAPKGAAVSGEVTSRARKSSHR
jgi:hypothetical protein